MCQFVPRFDVEGTYSRMFNNACECGWDGSDPPNIPVVSIHPWCEKGHRTPTICTGDGKTHTCTVCLAKMPHNRAQPAATTPDTPLSETDRDLLYTLAVNYAIRKRAGTWPFGALVLAGDWNTEMELLQSKLREHPSKHIRDVPFRSAQMLRLKDTMPLADVAIFQTYRSPAEFRDILVKEQASLVCRMPKAVIVDPRPDGIHLLFFDEITQRMYEVVGAQMEALY